MIDKNKQAIPEPVKTQEEIAAGWRGNLTPLVSVCCITYNHKSFLSEAVDSFLMQETDFPFEIIIHDDASTDGTTDIVKAYAERYPEIITAIIQSENQYSKGGLINLRFVFPKARGKYIAICEGDDYWTDKSKLQKQVSFLEKNPEYVITYTDIQPFDKNGNLDTDYRGARRDLESIELQKATPIFTLTTCFRNVLGVVPMDLSAARFGDLVTWSLLGSHGKGKYMADIKPAAYRVHEGGVHSAKSRKEKAIMALITRSCLFSYYHRNLNKELANYFFRKMLYSYVRVFWGIATSKLFEVMKFSKP